jgi:sulfur carrier protein
MFVVLNGERRELPPGSTVADVLQVLAGAPEGRGVAIAVEGQVVPRSAWTRTALRDGAHVEVVAAVQGG